MTMVLSPEHWGMQGEVARLSLSVLIPLFSLALRRAVSTFRQEETLSLLVDRNWEISASIVEVICSEDSSTLLIARMRCLSVVAERMSGPSSLSVSEI